MRNKLICWLPLFMVVPFGMLGNVQAQGLWAYHHAPYQDQHFNLNSTRRSDSGGYSTSSGSYRQGSAVSEQHLISSSMPNTDGECSKSGICLRQNNATLRLWVPEEVSVEINGQPTRHQSLAGIHTGSRIFSLEGLEFDRVSPCDIVVVTCDEFGQTVRLRHTMAVHAGKSFEVRFPAGFERFPNFNPERANPMQRIQGNSPLENIDLSEPEELKAPPGN